ncbi:MAG: ATP synthase F1 subunit epsilon [Cyanobacteria bacterium P01_H01_bin.74]
MQLKLITPDRVVVDESNVVSVSALAVDGSVGIMANHAPFVTPLDIGIVTYKHENGQKTALAVMAGMLQTDGKTVTIISTAAEKSTEVDALRAEEAKKRAELLMEQSDDAKKQLEAEMALKRSLTRLKVSSR